MSAEIRSQFEAHLHELQSTIVQKLERLDPTGPKFECMKFSDSPESSNITYLLQRTGSHRQTKEDSFVPIEKAVLVLTFLTNEMPIGPSDEYKGQPSRHSDITTPARSSRFYAAHLSVVIYPRSPHAPIGHGSWRYFEQQDGNGEATDWWFGGTTHLIPTSHHEEDWRQFHGSLKNSISEHGEEYIGIGGIFYDQLNDKHNPKLDAAKDDTPRPRASGDCLAFVKSAGHAFLSSYIPILETRALQKFTEEERRAQLIHRGRFVEQLLLVDEGIKFGLKTGSGAVDRILMILPEAAEWSYQTQDDKSSLDALASLMKGKPQEWA